MCHQAKCKGPRPAIPPWAHQTIGRRCLTHIYHPHSLGNFQEYVYKDDIKTLTEDISPSNSEEEEKTEELEKNSNEEAQDIQTEGKTEEKQKEEGKFDKTTIEPKEKEKTTSKTEKRKRTKAEKKKPKKA